MVYISNHYSHHAQDSGSVVILQPAPVYIIILYVAHKWSCSRLSEIQVVVYPSGWNYILSPSSHLWWTVFLSCLVVCKRYESPQTPGRIPPKSQKTHTNLLKLWNHFDEKMVGRQRGVTSQRAAHWPGHSWQQSRHWIHLCRKQTEDKYHQ